MQLLYLWINKDETGFIQQEGFSFSPEHRFSVNLSGSGQYTLHYTHTSQKDIWAQNNIVGLSAVVGENGTGKTALLRALYDLDILPMLHEDRAEYEALQEQRNQKAKKICIYQKQRGITVYHNFAEGELDNQTGFAEINVNTMGYVQVIDEDPEWQTRIFFSNGIYTEAAGGHLEHRQLQEVGLTPKGIASLAGSYYGKITMRNHRAKNYAFLHDQLRKSRSSQVFQPICDLIYYHSLNKKGMIRQVLLKRETSLSIGFDDVILQLQKVPGLLYLGDNSFVPVSNSLEETLHECAKRFLSWRSRIAREVLTDPIIILCWNLIFELQFIWEIQDAEEPVTTYQEGLDRIRKLLAKAPENTDQREIDYYHNALSEIEQLKELLNFCSSAENLVPINDTAFRFEYSISSETEPELFYAFCELIDNFSRSNTSFVLKYTRVRESPMSSGERALQNLLSWLNLLPQYDQYVSENAIPIRENILLLLDEIDMYMHPEWQRLCLSELSRNLEIQYPNHQIQLVISTHSPLVLSDIPLCNTLYLEKDGARLLKRPEEKHKETFAANIHDILNNGFFLKNSMGEFAYQKLKTVIEDLQRLRDDPKNEELRGHCRPHKNIIEIVGEPVLKRKLEMLYSTYVIRDETTQAVQYLHNIQSIPESLRSDASNQQIKAQILNALRQALEVLEGTV